MSALQMSWVTAGATGVNLTSQGPETAACSTLCGDGRSLGERGRPGGVLSRRVREVFTERDPLHPSSRELAGPAWSQDRVPARSFLFPSTRVCLHICKAHGGAAGIRRDGKPSPVTQKALLLGDWLLRSELPCLIHTKGLITPTSPGSS